MGRPSLSFSVAYPSLPDEVLDLFSVTEISILLDCIGINWPMIRLFVLFVFLVPLVPIKTLLFLLPLLLLLF